MVELKLTGKDGVNIARSKRAGLLRYRSFLLHQMTTLFFSPLLLSSAMEEKQTLKIVMFSDYIEDMVHSIY